MLDSWLPVTLFVGQLVFHLLLAALVLLRRSPHRASTLAWVVLVLALPFLGAIGYLLLGEVSLGERRRKRYRSIQERVHARCALLWADTRYPALDPRDQSIATLAESVGGTAPRAGNHVDLLGESAHAIDRLVADIEAAREDCHLLFYIYLSDEAGARVGAALERAAERGVSCRLLVDAVGSRAFLGSALAQRMRSAGVHVVEALPANLLRALFARLDLRNHRKLAIIDGAVGYTGSQNIADPSFAPKLKLAPWVDAMVRVEGPVVRDLQEVFVVDWYLDAEEALDELLERDAPRAADGMTVQILPTGPGSRNEAMAQLVQALLHIAREEILMTTPYFVPDEATLAALTTAARRGVHSVLVVPARNDSPLVQLASRSYYRELIDAGVEIHEYTAGLLHAKTISVDRRVALMSTANLDRRSFELNFEVSTLVFDSDFASQMRLLQRTYMDYSLRVDADRWRRRRWVRRILENAAGTLSPLL